ncbi:MAG TPA: Smr/MutS family protein [Candidatus Polarisedimenticolia bacterium]|nr:Smr/MutS family protein [Candidatus Polarisedimenticolia bacterium]
MDSRTLDALEFGALKRLIAPHARTPMGRRALEALLPAAGGEEIGRRRELTAEALRWSRDGGRLGPGPLDDPQPVVERLRPEGSVLDPLEVARLTGALAAAGSARRELAAAGAGFPALSELGASLPDLDAAIRPMLGAIAADGRLEDAAGPELAALRRQAAALEARIQRALQQVVDRAGRAGALQDDYVTVRNGRFVIPVRPEGRGTVPGVVHGTSSTGATVFVEPLETLELNNDLVTVRDRELAETRRILAAWSGSLRARLAEIEIAVDRLARLDLLGAVAAWAGEAGADLAQPAPQRGDPFVRLFEARHPVLERGLAARGDVSVPLTLEMPAEGGVLVLSGPNAGGKTVALKTLGLLALMNQAGLPVPAARAELPLFAQVLADIGDHQSIAESLSTFSARMARVSEMASHLVPPALVLIDEVAAGTDPEEAGALAVAIVDHFRRRGAAVVATTHHAALKEYAASQPGASNASMEIDARSLRPTYRLLPGLAGRSGGLDLAQRMGLPPDLIADARGRLSPARLEAEQRAAALQGLMEEKERELARLRAQREEERRLAEEARAAQRREAEALEERWRAAIASALEALDRAREEHLAGIQDRAVALQLRAEARRRQRVLRQQMEASLPPPPGAASPATPLTPSTPSIRPGTRVRLRGVGGSREEGIVEAVDARGRAEVAVRGKRISVLLADLEPGGGQEEPRAARTPPAGVRLDRRTGGEPGAELNLIGARVEEALDRLDKFLDQACLAGHARVRVVHGHGTGRLKQAVRKALAGHVHVASWEPAGEREGGDGATIAVLRD